MPIPPKILGVIAKKEPRTEMVPWANPAPCFINCKIRHFVVKLCLLLKNWGFPRFEGAHRGQSGQKKTIRENPLK